MEEETVEDVRNVEDGTARAWEASAWRTPPDDAAMREESPGKGARRRPGRRWLEILWRMTKRTGG
jgi:RES domain-containing protein